jgi:hypothetical protein
LSRCEQLSPYHFLMFEIFCLRLASGLALSLVFLPPRTVQPRFYRIQLMIVLGLTAAAAAWAWSAEQPDAFWLALGVGLAGSLVGTFCWSFEGAPGGMVAIGATFVALIMAAVSLTSPDARTLADTLTSAGLLGSATTAMLMAHWYLIAPTLSLQPLLRLLAVLFIAVILRAFVAAAGLWPWANTTIALDSVAWLWLGVRWLVGLAGPLVLGWMAWQAARIRATQSATGILYVVVIFIFLGELTDQLLQGLWDSGDLVAVL